MINELLRQLLSFTLASSAGMMVALMLRRPARHLFGAGACYSLWLLVPAAALATLLPHGGSTIAIPLRFEPASTLTGMLDASSGPFLATSPSTDWQVWALSLWCAGAAFFAAFLALQQHAFVRSLGNLSASRCGLRAARSDACPALLGLLRPRIVLPADFESRYTRLERRLILSHERTHLRRGDALCNGFVALLRAIFWFNPLIHLASGYFRMDQEFACDAAVMREYPAARRSYAGAMLKTQLAAVALPVGCHWHSVRGLKGRVEMLKRRMPSRRRRLSGAVLTALLSVLVGCATWTTQPAVSFPPEPAAPGSTQAVLTTGSVHVLHSTAEELTADIRKGRLVVRAMTRMALTADHVDSSYAIPAMLDMDVNAQRSFSSGGTFTPPRPFVAAGRAGLGQLPVNYMILEGHVHLTISSPAGATGPPQMIVLDTDGAIVARQPDGSSVVQFDKGRLSYTH